MTKLESDSIVSLVREYFEGPFGLSFFMAWIYATFYSTLIWVGESQGIASEYPWIISMATSGLIGIAGCLALGLKAPQPIRTRPWAFAGAAVACAIGTIAVASCSRADNPSPILVAVGAAFAAVGFSALTLAWGNRISECNDAMIEFSVPMSFIIARIVFALIGLTDPSISFALVALLPLVSILFLGGGTKLFAAARSGNARDPLREPETNSPLAATPLIRIKGVVAATMVLLVFRIGYGIIRAIEAGSSSEGIWYFLSVFVLPIAVFGIFVVLALTAARSLTTSLVTRWMLPILLLALALLPVDGEVGHQYARAANSIASMILQAFFWIILAKAAHKRPGSGTFFFSCYLVGLCLGMAIGVSVGLGMLSALSPESAWQALPFVSCALVAATMALEGRARRFGSDDKAATPIADSTESGTPEDMLDTALKDQARRIAEVYKLSPREEEIIAYLLAGRNRPYIRDALFISLNTVNTHIKNAFAKLDIHSQQELLDVARSEFPIQFQR